MLVHLVFFWKKPDATPEQLARLIADCKALLPGIPGVHDVKVGPPAMTPRPVVDNTYAVGLLVLMTDMAAHDVYQTHPLHLEFIARNKATWERVLIYDYFSV